MCGLEICRNLYFFGLAACFSYRLVAVKPNFPSGNTKRASLSIKLGSPLFSSSISVLLMITKSVSRRNTTISFQFGFHRLPVGSKEKKSEKHGFGVEDYNFVRHSRGYCGSGVSRNF